MLNGGPLNQAYTVNTAGHALSSTNGAAATLSHMEMMSPGSTLPKGNGYITANPFGSQREMETTLTHNYQQFQHNNGKFLLKCVRVLSFLILGSQDCLLD